MSLRAPIPEETRTILSEDNFMRECIVKDTACAGRVEWQHAMTYGGKRISDIWALLPMCTRHHKEQAKYRQLQEAAVLFRIHQYSSLEAVREKYPKMRICGQPAC